MTSRTENIALFTAHALSTTGMTDEMVDQITDMVRAAVAAADQHAAEFGDTVCFESFAGMGVDYTETNDMPDFPGE